MSTGMCSISTLFSVCQGVTHEVKHHIILSLYLFLYNFKGLKLYLLLILVYMISKHNFLLIMFWRLIFGVGFPIFCHIISSVQSLSRVRLFATPWIAARQASLSISNSQSSLRLNVHRVSDAIKPSHPLLSPSPPAPNQSLFQWVKSSHEVAKVLEFQL